MLEEQKKVESGWGKEGLVNPCPIPQPLHILLLLRHSHDHGNPPFPHLGREGGKSRCTSSHRYYGRYLTYYAVHAYRLGIY